MPPRFAAPSRTEWSTNDRAKRNADGDSEAAVHFFQRVYSSVAGVREYQLHVEQENNRLRTVVADLTRRQRDPEGGGPGKLTSPAKRRRAVVRFQEALGHSERRICRVLEQARSTQRHERSADVEEDRLRARITTWGCDEGRYGYRQVTRKLRAENWRICLSCEGHRTSSVRKCVFLRGAVQAVPHLFNPVAIL